MTDSERAKEIRIGKYGFHKSVEGVWISTHYFDPNYAPDKAMLTEPAITLLEALAAVRAEGIAEEREANIKRFQELVWFLQGKKPFNGEWFPMRKEGFGAYWWRTWMMKFWTQTKRAIRRRS